MQSKNFIPFFYENYVNWVLLNFVQLNFIWRKIQEEQYFHDFSFVFFMSGYKFHYYEFKKLKFIGIGDI